MPGRSILNQQLVIILAFIQLQNGSRPPPPPPARPLPTQRLLEEVTAAGDDSSAALVGTEKGFAMSVGVRLSVAMSLLW